MSLPEDALDRPTGVGNVAPGEPTDEVRPSVSSQRYISSQPSRGPELSQSSRITVKGAAVVQEWPRSNATLAGAVSPVEGETDNIQAVVSSETRVVRIERVLELIEAGETIASGDLLGRFGPSDGAHVGDNCG